MDTQKSKKKPIDIKDIYMYVLGAVIVIGVYLITVFFLYKETPAGNKDIMLMLIGAFLAKFADVVGYFFGSSKGSADKNKMLYDSTPKKDEESNNASQINTEPNS